MTTHTYRYTDHIPLLDPHEQANADIHEKDWMDDLKWWLILALIGLAWAPIMALLVWWFV